ncbi:MAG: DegT/DnrJ/EryC1/StrS family aminotransferase, partial [Candidatus Micrarchaeota archaeon]|nr:DegT/DnrJ/EryC1/StrS family aminotransferase [Candidatus Micrarchaeota archaeon]
MRVNLMNPVCSPKMVRAAVSALKTERFLRGKSVEEFEREFAQYVGSKHAIAVNNGTMALVMSMVALGIKKDDHVMTTPASFIATANAILFVGAKPVFVDIDAKTNNIDPARVEEEILKHEGRIKAIMPVHLYGHPAEMDSLSQIAQRHNVKIIEDACQAHGARYKGRGAGSIGDAGAFSFYPSKNLTVCGDGGMVTTNSQDVAERVQSLRENGRTKDNQYLHQYIGFTGRLNTANAAIGRVQLSELEKWNEKRRRNARRYSRGLK